MIYEQFIVSIVELIMLSWQPILLYNFHNMRVTWLFYDFLKLQVHILHSLENISIFNIWKLWLVRCDVIFSRTSLILPKMSENFWSKEIPLWWFPDSTLKLNNSRTAWPTPAIYISFSSILNALSYEINLFSRCSSPLIASMFVLNLELIGHPDELRRKIPFSPKNGNITHALTHQSEKLGHCYWGAFARTWNDQINENYDMGQYDIDICFTS